MKRNPTIAQRIKQFREAHYSSQKALADALGVGQTVVSAWETGNNEPSSPAWVKLGNLAGYPDCKWFWQQAGIDEQLIVTAGENILKGRSGPVAAGEVVRVPRFRETLKGRESAGEPVPLPVEFIPNPLSTICFVVDEWATAVVDSPHAVFILDETDKDIPDLTPFWGQVIFAEYNAAGGANAGRRSGIYAGRLVRFNSWPRTREDTYTTEAELYPLTGIEAKRPLHLGWRAYPLLAGSGDIGSGHRPRGQDPVLDAAREKVSLQAASELRLSLDWRILGRSIGRLKMSEVQNVPKWVDI